MVPALQLITNVQDMFESSANLQFVSAQDAFEKKTDGWIKFEDATTNSLKIVSDLTEKCISSVSIKSSFGHSDALAIKMLEGDFEIEEIHKLVADLIIAAADTTSYSTLWSFYLLTTHTDIQEKARVEVLMQQPEEKELLSVDHLRYLHRCNKESMRMFPVAPFLTRMLNKPLKLSDNILLEKDQLILLSSYAMSRNEKYFRNPNKFWPERWERLKEDTIGGNVSSSKQSLLRGVSADNGAVFASLPFGFGIRGCIGRKVAEHQMVYFLGRLLQKFKFHSDNTDAVNLHMKLIGMPDKPIKISLSKLY